MANVSVTLEKLKTTLKKVFSLGQTYLAHGSSDGSIGLVKIVQKLRPLPTSSILGEELTGETVFETLQLRPFEPDNRGITALTWVEPPARSVSVNAYMSGLRQLGQI